MVDKITEFRGKYDFLSNFYSREGLIMDGLTFGSAEAAFQACKTSSMGDRVRIANAMTPGIAKKLGQEVKLFDDWEDIKVMEMLRVVRVKFNSNYALMEQLLDTGDAELIEGNHWGDTFWGQVNGEGENWLGRILMKVRAELRETP